ncbi:hypothetical protein [Enterobacter bugandensis]|uniref:hypothetical protein n=1 Tax=Enterobacter bugandensis TaxID=881260 RepID=UPI002004DB04|nr:hypothetical protein [Enterobacter bugandensis]MCK7082155.1 hypothetical protein [Enterobacter bugandensis]
MQIFDREGFKLLAGFLAEQESEKQKQRGDTDARQQRQLCSKARTAENIDYKLLIIEKVWFFNGRAEITFTELM